MQLVLRSPGDYRTVYDTMEWVKQQARESGLFVVVDSDLDYNKPVSRVEIDRSKAASMGISLRDIADSLAVLVGENYLNRFSLDGRSYDVIPQSQRELRLTAQALTRQFVRSANGELVPLSTMVSRKANRLRA